MQKPGNHTRSGVYPTKPQQRIKGTGLYIVDHRCISPQKSFGVTDLDQPVVSHAGKLLAIEPPLEGVAPGMLRRMSKAVRMSLGAGLPLLREHETDGIIIGTAYGGMDNCIKFLNQIIDYEEGLLTPGDFVQSTPNAIAGQLSLATKNQKYNITHVHYGLAFENALMDAMMLLHENPRNQYLVGGVDEISTYNYNIDRLAGWYNPAFSSEHLFDRQTTGTVAGEGSAMFLAGLSPGVSNIRLEAVEIFHATDVEKVAKWFGETIGSTSVETGEGTLFFSGENGDIRMDPFNLACEKIIPDLPVIRFKQLCGDYPTASAFALWLACEVLQVQKIPKDLIKTGIIPKTIDTIIIYNNYQGRQHSFIRVSIK
jgi:hypothetical protein